MAAAVTMEVIYTITDIQMDAGREDIMALEKMFMNTIIIQATEMVGITATTNVDKNNF
jgi:hypothetical protein